MKIMKKTMVLLAASILAPMISHASEPTPIRPIKHIEEGDIQGIRQTAMDAFLGIPYAAPPVGDLRWKRPQPVSNWDEMRDASNFASPCVQGTGGSEDCLYLNVFTPSDDTPEATNKKMPVMVFIHGGGNTSGTGSTIDPTRFVDKGIVVVTINYRLGLFGFLAHPALTAETNYGGSGNYAIMDQQAALKWVRKNIKSFGGDRKNITVIGQSAGALDILTQTTSPQADGLFQKAIVMSGGYNIDVAPPLAAAEAAGVQAMNTTSCAGNQTASCLRSLPASTFVPLAGSPVPNIDNKFVTQTVLNALTTGNFSKVPVLMGTTHDEMRYFTALFELFSGPLTPEMYPFVINAYWPFIPVRYPNLTVPVILAEYPLTNYDSASIAISTVGTDPLVCLGRTAIDLLSDWVPTYGYEFNDPNAPGLPGIPPISFPLGAAHGFDLPYIIDFFPAFDPQFTTAQQELADTMVSYWANFARKGNPNSGDTPSWHKYKSNADKFQLLAPSAVGPITTFATDHKCSFWVTN